MCCDDYLNFPLRSVIFLSYLGWREPTDRVFSFANILFRTFASEGEGGREDGEGEKGDIVTFFLFLVEFEGLDYIYLTKRFLSLHKGLEQLGAVSSKGW